MGLLCKSWCGFFGVRLLNFGFTFRIDQQEVTLNVTPMVGRVCVVYESTRMSPFVWLMEGFREDARCLSLGVAVQQVDPGLNKTFTKPPEVDPVSAGQMPHGWTLT